MIYFRQYGDYGSALQLRLLLLSFNYGSMIQENRHPRCRPLGAMHAMADSVSIKIVTRYCTMSFSRQRRVSKGWRMFDHLVAFLGDSSDMITCLRKSSLL